MRSRSTTGISSSALILCGWIRGLGEEETVRASKEQQKYESEIRRETGRLVTLFYFESGTGLYLTNLLGTDTFSLAQQISKTVMKMSGADHFYTTCSFVVGVSEANIPQDIRRARNFINNHQETAGVFFIDGHARPINQGL